MGLGIEPQLYAQGTLNPMLVELKVSKEESSSEGLTVTCHNMAGDVLATVSFQPEEDDAMTLRQKIVAAVDPEYGPASLHLVMPGGERLRDLDSSKSLRELMGVVS